MPDKCGAVRINSSAGSEGLEKKGQGRGGGLVPMKDFIPSAGLDGGDGLGLGQEGPG